MLTNLVSATGFDLRLQLARPIDRLTGPVGRRVRRNRRKIRAIAADHGARNLRLFGSVARGDDRPDSDVDLLADLRPGTGLPSPVCRLTSKESSTPASIWVTL